MDNGGTGNYWRNREYYETEHSVIMSRAVSARVVEKLGLQNDPKFLGLDRISDEKARRRPGQRAGGVVHRRKPRAQAANHRQRVQVARGAAH
jgi:uncharacterized protein involved in exopolysaccharide biosynthesis